MARNINLTLAQAHGYAWTIGDEFPVGWGPTTVREVMTVVCGISHYFAMDPAVYNDPDLRDKQLRMFADLLENQ